MPPKKKTKTPSKKDYIGWNLFKHGVTQSLLCKFDNDTERFHIRYAKGLRPVNRKEAMEYGTIFHKLIEIGAKMGNKYNHTKAKLYMSRWAEKKYAGDNVQLVQIALVQYEHYRRYEKTLPSYRYIDQEIKFDEVFELPPTTLKADGDNIHIRIPPGVKLKLKGRIDELLSINGDVWIMENKTKSKIDLDSIQNTIHKNIQVMLYALCVELKYGVKCKGIIYNIIRKPQLVQRAGREDKKTKKRIGAESDRQFLKRISDDIEKHPEHYFIRLEYAFPPNALKIWTKRSLIPMLYRIYLWWRSIEANPLDPWEVHGEINPLHSERPFGIFDPLSTGVGEYFGLLTTGSTQGLEKVTEVFPELEDEAEDEELNKLLR